MAQLVDVVVVGGGITGLAAAHRVVESGRPDRPAPSVVVLESADRPGGQIRTERHGAFLIEGGPDALVAQKPAGIALCERIGLRDELRYVEAGRGATQIVHRGRLHPVPDGFLMMAPTRWSPVLSSSLFTWRGKLRMACEPLVPRRSASCADESLASFVRRRFGREALERIAEPVVAGLFTADADELSLRLAMPRFLDLEAEQGSVTRGLRRSVARARFGHGTGRSGFVALAGGMGRMVEALAARLPQGTMRTGARANSITFSAADRGWTVSLASGEVLHATAMVLAIPAGEAATALGDRDDRLTRALGTLRYASCATVNLAYRSKDVAARLSGFGFFVPRTERLPLLACSYVSEKFEARTAPETVLLRAFVGGATQPQALDAGDDALIERTHAALSGVLALQGPPLFAKVHRSLRSMPQYSVGAAEAIASIQSACERHPGLFLAGSTVGAFGLPDCIRSGETAADKALALLAADQRAAGAIEPGSSAWVAYQANQNA